ncbi:MAG: oligosaccharide flippase family protein [Candidatus Hydrogenedentes bacterium]|nr:oligosaccharide flippase family protein [Candidatus Hydrogenedentota bacterium]
MKFQHSTKAHKKSGTIEGAFWSWLSTVVNLIALLVVGKLIAVYLPKEQVAIFSLLLVWSDGLTLLFGYGLQVSIPKIIGGSSDSEKSTVSKSILTFVFLNSILISALLFLIWFFSMNTQGKLLSYFQSSIIYPYFWLIPILFVSAILRDTLLANLSGFQIFGKRAVGVTLASILQIVTSLGVLILIRGGVIALAIAYTLSYFVASLFLFYSLPHSSLAKFRCSHVTSAIKFSWILWINSILNYLVQRFDTILFLYLTGNPAQVAIYEMAKRLCQLASRMLNSLLLPYLPKISELLSEGKDIEATKFFTQAQISIATISLFSLFLLPLIQKYLILFLFSAEYLEITTVLSPLIAGVVIAVLTGISGQTLIASNRPYLVTLTNIGTVIISIGMNFILIPRFGLPGAGWSALISFAFSFLSQTLWVRKTSLKFEWKHVLTTQIFLGIFLALSLMNQTITVKLLNVILISILLIISIKYDFIPYRTITEKISELLKKRI